MSRPAAAVHGVIKAYDVRGLVGTEIDEQFVAEVGSAFARLVRAEGATQVVVGYDMRASSPLLASAFADGVTAQGLDVVRIGLASTDELYFASGLLDCPGAMFTASHNPAAYNGIKLCRAGAKPVGKDTGLSVISDEVIAGVPGYEGAAGTVTDRDVLADYGAFLRSLVDLSSLRDLRIAVDGGFLSVTEEGVIILAEAADDRYGLAATVLTGDMAHAQQAWRRLPVGTVKINDVFGGAPGGAAEPRRASGSGFGFGPELLDEMTATKVVHWSPPESPS